MENNQLTTQAQQDSKKLLADFQAELVKFRLDRAHPSLVDNILVEVYEQKQPLNQLASIMTPDAKTIQIKPFLSDNIKAIIEAIRADRQLGLSPTDDGQIIYLTVPPLTAERRQQLVKQIQLRQEDFLIKLRQLRHDYIKGVKDDENLSKTDSYRLSEELEVLFKKSKEATIAAGQMKEKEVLNANVN